MFELTINEQVYQFRFGFGFLKEINKKVVRHVDGLNKDENVGLEWAVANLIDGNVENLVEVLFIANKGDTPRLTEQDIEAYIEKPDTDIDALFKTVLDFLRRSNCTKKAVMKLENQVAKAGQTEG